MTYDSRLALFVMLGQTATKTVGKLPEVALADPLLVSDTHDLSTTIPEAVREANSASVPYRLFYVFENYLRQLVVQVLSNDGQETWWDKIPKDVQEEVERTEENEQVKVWMALGARDKSALLTYPQLLRVMDYCWKDDFEEIIRDKALIQEARHIAHLRNTTCHMSNIAAEEIDRIRQVMRDWFRAVSP